ncbi:MAG: Gfo/Idh/MocA family oxidoreductase [Bacillota bacterium]
MKRKRIGFVGAESMHTVYFGSILAAGVGGLDSSSGHLWAPDTPQLALPRMAAGELADSCASLDELLEISDAVMILPRDGDSHRELAEACIAQGKPVFVDKPFACSAEDAEAMLAFAEQSGVPLMGGSTLCWLPETAEAARLAREAAEITISFAADWYSPHGGWYYYGSHLTDLCAAIAGCDPIGLEAAREGNRVQALVRYPELLVRLDGSPEQQALVFKFTGRAGAVTELAVPDYERCYRLGMERFSRMLREGESVHPERLLFSTRLLDTIIKTLNGDEIVLSGFLH